MLRQLSKDDVLHMLRTKVHPSSSERAKLVVRLQSQVPAPQHEDGALSKPPRDVLEERVITDVPAFKSELHPSDNALPVQPLSQLAADPKNDEPLEHTTSVEAMRANI